MRKYKERIFNIIQIGTKDNLLSRSFDYFIVIVIFLNLFATLFSTYKESERYSEVLYAIELVTSVIFTIEYILRVWTAEYLYPGESKIGSKVKFIFSFYGIIDLLTFLPFYLPLFFPAGAVAFRLLRVIRIFRLFKINTQYDAFNVITSVLKEKKNQLISSCVMILILMVASSLCMYSVEHDVQPDAFKNAFSGIWWSASTLLTVGYGDIYPVTTIGKVLAIVISFLGVGMVAIPTGIISAGFVEHYSLISEGRNYMLSDETEFKEVLIKPQSEWKDKKIKDLDVSRLAMIVMIRRGDQVIIPRGDTVIKADDKVIMYTKRN
ncbi:MAG: ion transporter [Lachnospiraceae bacterium]|nr:ion transporter [Lachnospiraceae bacterium]